MAKTLTLDSKLSDCTVGDLLALFEKAVARKATHEPKQRRETAESVIINGEVCYKGIAGVQYIFKIGRTKAVQYKSSKWLQDAIIQEGRTLFVKRDLALSLYNQRFSQSAN